MKTFSVCTSLFITSLFVFSNLSLLAQGSKVHIGDILIEGLRHTKSLVLYRELDVASGDTLDLSTLSQTILRNEKRLLSTGLFNLADINIINWDTSTGLIDLKISVQENWYFYPAPIFELADRNFNVWWKEKNRSFSRVNYGLRLDHLNLTGHKDKAKLILQNGYTRKLEVDYQYPYFYKNWGLGGNAYYAENKEIGYTTLGNKILFIKNEDERILLQRLRASINFYRRNNAFIYQSLQFQYHKKWIDESIAQHLNPDYFLDKRTTLQYFQLEYDIRQDKRIFSTYPEGGYMLEFNIRKEGLGIHPDFDNLSIALIAEKHFKFNSKWYAGGRFKVRKIWSNGKVPYAQNNGLGYGGDRVRGYELYVIDGTDFALAKTSVRYKFLEKKFNIGSVIDVPAFRVLPFTTYFRFALESGYIKENYYAIGNSLNNQYLLGFGPAIDVLLYNNYVISLEYNTNHLGQSGLYFESSFNF